MQDLRLAKKDTVPGARSADRQVMGTRPLARDSGAWTAARFTTGMAYRHALGGRSPFTPI